MQTQNTQTGYPSIDRPWLQYFADDAINGPIPEGSIYDMIWRVNGHRKNDLAIEFFKSKITYGQLFADIDRTARGFLKLGVKGGDIVTMALLNSPENVICLYALNKIGATVNLVDFRTAGEKLAAAINSVHSDLVLISDMSAHHAVEIQTRVQVKNWVVVSLFESFRQPIRAFLKLKNRYAAVKQLSNRISWAQLQKLGEESKDSNPSNDSPVSSDSDVNSDSPVSSDSDVSNDSGVSNNSRITTSHKGKSSDVACIFHTSGTTSMPKSVMLTNGNLNSISYYYQHSRMELRENERFLSHVPPFLAYNTIFTIHMPFSMKMTVAMVPGCTAEEFPDLVMKLKPNHIAGGSAGWREFTRNPRVKGQDFSFFRAICSGNDKLEPEVKAEINAIVAAGGCKYELLEGYGMTECSSVVTACWPDVNPLESIGIPHCKNIISIFDPEDPERELTYGEKGEICISGPTVMAGYYGDPTTTASVLKMHSDGRIWFHSGDLGHMNEKGWLYFDGRAKRTIVKFNGFKIAPGELEEVVYKCENVSECCVVGHPDTEHGRGQIPVAFIVLKDVARKKETIAEIRGLCEELILPEYRIRAYGVIEKLPLTQNEKIDYRALEKMPVE